MPKFFEKLFDFSFKEFVTPGIIKVIYLILIGLTGLYVLFQIFMGFYAGGFTTGLLYLIISPIIGLVMVIFARVYLEVVMVLFRMLGLLQGIAEAKGVSATPEPAVAADPPPPPAS